MFLQWPQWKPYKSLACVLLSFSAKSAVQQVSLLHAWHWAYSLFAGDDMFLWNSPGRHCSALIDTTYTTSIETSGPKICIKTFVVILNTRRDSAVYWLRCQKWKAIWTDLVSSSLLITHRSTCFEIVSLLENLNFKIVGHALRNNSKYNVN